MKATPNHLDIGRELLGEFAENFPYMLVLLDPDLQILWASPSSHEVIGHASDSLTGTSILDLLHPGDLEQITPMVLGMVDAAEETYSTRAAASMAEVPVRVRSATNTWIPVSASGRLVDETGKLMAVVRPAAERHSLGRVLDRLAGGSDLPGVLDSLLDLLRVQFGLERATLLHDFDGHAVAIGDRIDMPRGSVEGLLTRLRKTGPSPDIEFDDGHWMVPVLSRTGESLFGAFSFPSPRTAGPTTWDASILHRTVGLASVAFTRAQDTRLLEQAASTDYLTDVLNRRSFESSLAQLALRPEAFPATVFFLDVDKFKSVNDEHGHRAGDETLIEVARRLRGAVRAGDLIGRLGGDEFAICTPGLTPAGITATRSRIEASFRRPITTTTATLNIGLSIGFSTAATEDDLEHVIDRADTAMYRSKLARAAEGGA